MASIVTPELLEVPLLREDAVLVEDADTGALLALPRLTAGHAADPRWIVLIDHDRAAGYYAAARSRGKTSRLAMAAKAATLDLAAELALADTLSPGVRP